ncbi:MAG TPA: thymidine phosphorylase [Ruminococcus sp.]|nr:thymidine phosphorylase [Ruminococcus sp.]
MQMYDLIQKTRRLEPLTIEEIRFLVGGYTGGSIPDYMMSAWLMAVCCQGLTVEETTELTFAMRDSGQCLDLSAVNGVTVDKHSTGGIGDKTTLLVAPIVASCGGYVAKMSGRGLGFTGGTIDKLESIPDFSVTLDREDFIRQTNQIGCCIIYQSGNLTPADKKIYALRNLTATVDSIPLICSSIMSKKLAMGADGILLDVKYGYGAFMKTPEEASVLANLMVDVGKQAGRNCRAVITNMNAPLGSAVGNALEVKEVIQMLRGEIRNHLTELSLALSAQMLTISGKGDIITCRQMAEKALTSGMALEKFAQMIEAQGGNAKVVENLSLLPESPVSRTISARSDGFITEIHSEEVGLACLGLGAGRTADNPNIDMGAGVVFHHFVGDYVPKGEPLFTVYGQTEALCQIACNRIMKAVRVKEAPAVAIPMIYQIIE